MELLLDEERSRSTSSSSLNAGPPPVDKCPSTPGNKFRWDTVESGVDEHVPVRGISISSSCLRGERTNNNIVEEDSPGLSRCGALGACLLHRVDVNFSQQYCSIQNVCTLVD